MKTAIISTANVQNKTAFLLMMVCLFLVDNNQTSLKSKKEKKNQYKF